MTQHSASEQSIKNSATNFEKINNSIFQIPNFNSTTYKNNISELFRQMEQLDNYTLNLEQKVDRLLLNQQKQFVNAYTSHMKKIKHQFKAFEESALKQQQLIKYYENEGKMSNLIKKVAMLEEQSKNLYTIIAKKDKQIKSLLLSCKVDKEENKRLMAQMKQFLRNRNENEVKKRIATKPLENQFFPTEVIEQERSLQKNMSKTTDEKGKLGFLSNSSDNSLLGLYQPKPDYSNTMKKKINDLQKKNRQLLSLNSKVLQSRNQFEQLFFDAVNQIKKQVKLRKQIKFCSYEDFRKQDKLNLLVTVISNQQILKMLYEGLFVNSFSAKNVFNPEATQKLSQKGEQVLKETNSEFINNKKYSQQKGTSSRHLSEYHRKGKFFYPQQKLNMKKRARNTIERGKTQDLSVLPYL